MQFPDYETIIHTKSQPIPVRVTGSALHVLWSEGVGPQTAERLFYDNRELFEEIASDKLLARDLDDGVVVIGDVDVEG